MEFEQGSACTLPQPPTSGIVELASGGRSILELGPALTLAFMNLRGHLYNILAGSWGGMTEGVWGILSSQCWLSPITGSADRQKEADRWTAAVQGLFLCRHGWFCTSS